MPGTVNADALAYNTVTNLFQAVSNDGQNVYFETFTAGAQTDASGNANPNLSGGFAIAKSAPTDSLASQIIGKGTLDGLPSFMAQRTETLHLLGSQALAQLISGPLNFTNDNWAGPGGAGHRSGKATGTRRFMITTSWRGTEALIASLWDRTSPLGIRQRRPEP